jgi:cytochrome c2
MTSLGLLRAGLTIVAIASITNCAAPGSTAPAPTTTDGAELFDLRAIGGSPGCVTCHSLTPEYVLVGPSLAGVADRAGGRVDGMDADAYLKQSIVDPDAHIVETFTGPKMPGNYGEILSDEQIAALVAYLKETT